MDSTIVGALIQAGAVLLAAVPLIITLRQGTAQSRRQAASAIVSADREIWLRLLSSDDQLLAWWLRTQVNLTNANEPHLNKQRLYMLLMLGHYESIYELHGPRVESDRWWQGWRRTLAADAQDPTFAEVWRAAGHWYSPGFQAIINEYLPQA